jgi:hypothetical protein
VDLVAITQQWARPLRDQAAKAAVTELLNGGWDLLRALPQVARHLVSLAEKLDDGVLQVRLPDSQLRRLEAAQRASSRRLIAAVIASAVALAALTARWLKRSRPA